MPPALLTLALPASLPTEPCNFQMGTDQAPNGDTLNVDTCKPVTLTDLVPLKPSAKKLSELE